MLNAKTLITITGAALGAVAVASVFVKDDENETQINLANTAVAAGLGAALLIAVA